MVQVMIAARQHAPSLLPVGTDNVRIATETSGADVLRRLEDGPSPDIVLLDFELPGLSGLKGVQQARARLGNRPLASLASHAPNELALRILASGADAVLPPDIDETALLSAIALLAAGERFSIFPHDFRPRAHVLAEPLSERELQVLQGICAGLQNKEIAHAFQVQEVTAKMHVRAIIRKLGARNRTQAAMIARDLGIV